MHVDSITDLVASLAIDATVKLATQTPGDAVAAQKRQQAAATMGSLPGAAMMPETGDGSAMAADHGGISQDALMAALSEHALPSSALHMDEGAMDPAMGGTDPAEAMKEQEAAGILAQLQSQLGGPTQ